MENLEVLANELVAEGSQDSRIGNFYSSAFFNVINGD
jgi:hypothetical protein